MTAILSRSDVDAEHRPSLAGQKVVPLGDGGSARRCGPLGQNRQQAVPQIFFIADVPADGSAHR